MVPRRSRDGSRLPDAEDEGCKMAARDETYRDQKMLDIVFAVSSILMLLSLIWMFWVDYNRPFKSVQRKGFDIEVAVLEHQAERLTEENATQIEAAASRLREELEKTDLGVSLSLDEDDLLAAAKQAIQARTQLPPDSEFVILSERVSAMKAVRDSIISQRDQLQERGAPPLVIAELEARVQAMNEEIWALEKGPGGVEDLAQRAAQREQEIKEQLRSVSVAVADLDRLVRERDRLMRTARQKSFGWGARIRALPILDAFASPFRIRQDIPEGLTIDYNFKQVQRNDRCMTCHMFSDRLGFDKEVLADLPEKIRPKLGEFNVYCNHPRLDLYVGSNSPHPVEKFGCTICHSGMGGAATFSFAYHSPDTGKTDGKEVETYEEMKARWQKDRNWHHDLHPDYMWDHPMLPRRFLESSCVKCHHQILDLVKTDGREEAPKLIKGYRLVRDLGCFGCHEIQGYKGGRPIGPDMRLEPYPPLDDLTPLERANLTSDPNDPPGKLRKVGPGLRRLAEKVGEKNGADWTARWIRSPRSFRYDTQMPHFFGLTNNNPDQLSDTQPDGPSQVGDHQKGFPDAEIHSMTFYLLKASQIHLAQVRQVHDLDEAAWSQFERTYQEFVRLSEQRKLNPQLVPNQNHPKLPRDASPALLAKLPAGKPNLTFEQRLNEEPTRECLTKDQLQMVLGWFAEQMRYRKHGKTLDELPYPPGELADKDGKMAYQANAANGGLLFQKHGCAACHSHEAVKIYDDKGVLLTQADYGPNLIGLREKLGYDDNPQRAEKWLYYWLSDPTRYHPRTNMPNPQLTPQQRADLVAWLLTGTGNVAPPPPQDGLLPWSEVRVTEGDIRGLAKTYLDKALPRQEAEQALNEGLADVSALRLDADERILARNPPTDSPFHGWTHDQKLTYYVGRKSIARYGCFACHDIPGFENAKPIGTPINDWGKKDADRLAFDNILDYVERYRLAHGEHGHGSGHGEHGESASGSQPSWTMEPFFFDALKHHSRIGFLYQKLREPRSYDYAKIPTRPWDDRLKMPQFKFSRIKPNKGESPEEFAARAAKEEHDNIEAVMTFVLGLVAEPIPLKFVNTMREDRRHEVAGLQVLEKFNCIGCHIAKPAYFDAVMTEDLLAQLRRYHGRTESVTELARDPAFPEHSAWRSQMLAPNGKLIARGLPLPGEDEESINIELWEAIRFMDADGLYQDFPAGLSRIQIPVEAIKHSHGAYGGMYANVLMHVLAETQRKNLVLDRGYLAGSVPPPLMREGQKVQPQWLYNFLKQPHEIRPTVAANLKMPRFTLSHEDLEDLVHYFIAVDRIENPALGLEYFGKSPPQRDPDYQELLRRQYQARIAEYMKGAPGFDPKKHDYFESGWQLLVNENLCVKCHNIGNFKAGGKDEEKGPPLNLAADRLRPEYIERWVSFPKRLIPYTLMPQYDPFYAPDREYFHLQQALQRPETRRMVELGPLLGSQTAPRAPFVLGDEAYNQLQLQFATLPADKTRAVRDALMSWGYLADPPPTARAAGSRVQSSQGEQK